MEIKKEKNGDSLTIKLCGRLDYTNAEKLDAEFENLSGVKNLVIDLKELELISSSGLRSILNAAETMENQGEMKIINARPEIKEIFEISGFTDFLNFE